MTARDLRRAVHLAVRRPGWGLALGLNAVAVAFVLAALRWGPAAAAAPVLTLAAVLLAAATASLLDDDLAELSSTTPTPLRTRSLVRLALGLLAAAAAWWAVVQGGPRVAPDVWPGGGMPAAGTFSAVALVAAGAAVGAFAARVPGDLPAAVPTVLLLTPAAFLVDDVPWPGPLRDLARAAALDPGERTAWTVVAAGLVVLLATRDRAAAPRP